ncbi:MAG: hypothetical protein EBQ94_01820 [Flavobacteriales bacterium]|nr:hypothetical protein [Flavobacteriales bacterium]
MTFFFLVYLNLASTVNQEEIDWMFNNSFTYIDFQKNYPNYTFTAYLLFKVIPFSGTAILILLHIALILKSKKNYLIYVDGLKNKVFLKKFWLEIIVFIFVFQVLKTPNNCNFYYSVSLTFSILLFYVFYKKNWFKKRTNSLLYLILVAILLRLVYLSQTGIYDAREDSLARVAQIYEWVQFGGIPGNLIWLPGYHLIIYGISILFNVSFETGGVLLSLFSSFGLIIITYLLFEKFFDRLIGFLVAGFIVFNPYFVQFSVNQMVEVPFLFFIVSGTYFAVLYFEKSRIQFLIFSILAFNIANLMRFEGWIITFLFMVVFLFQNSTFRKTLILFIPSAFSAIYIALLSFIKWGDPFYGVTASDIEVAIALQFRGSEIFHKVFSSIYWNNWVPMFFIPILFIGLLIGAFKEKQRYFAIGILLLISYYCFKMFTGTLEPFWRYFSVALIFSLPYFFFFLKEYVSSFSLLFLVFIFLPYWSIHKIDYIINEYSSLPIGFHESAYFFKKNSSPNDKVILSMNPYSDDELWIAISGRTLDSNTFSNWYPGMKITRSRKPFTIQQLKKKITKEKFEWLVIDRAYSIDSLFEDKEFANYYNSVKKQSDTIGDFVIIKIKH